MLSTALAILPLVLPVLTPSNAQVTVYTESRARPTPVSGNSGSDTISASPTTTLTRDWNFYTNLPAYDTLRLIPPTPISPPLASYTVVLPLASGLPSDRPLSIPIPGNLLGFSVELSVADTILGVNGKILKPEFLNYLANIRNRAGVGAVVRVGGNSQEGSTLYENGLEDGSTIEKIKISEGVTDTPLINFSPNLFHAMSNITSLVGTQWYFGLAFNSSDVATGSTNVPLVAEYANRILGDNLKGLQIGNEPDLYTDHGERDPGWNVNNYVSEYTATAQLVLANSPTTASRPPKFMGPSLCCERQGFELPDVVNAGFLTQNMANLGSISVQQYPTNNCGINGRIDPQSIFADFLNHTSAERWTTEYADISRTAVSNEKELVMMEMNSASCGGFPGLSDSFGAAMWMTDWTLQLATYNFSVVLMHVGGQNVYYNPFTPPPGNLTRVYQWTTGSVYYSSLIVSELFGRANNPRVVDMTYSSSIPPTYNADGSTSTNAVYHPTYVVYEGDVPTRAILFNYISDTSGASTSQVTLSFNGPSAPSIAYVRYFSAVDIAEQYNITWAGQTMGTSFTSDGTLKGEQLTTNVTCTPEIGCVISLPAPSIAVVFFNQAALFTSAIGNSSDGDQATMTFGTTIIGSGSATFDPKVLETSNGQNSDELGKTNKFTPSSGAGRSVASCNSGAMALGSLVFGLGISFIGF